ncbi:MAG: hydrogenase maturation nickel metallochaperone HypA [Bacteroidetes bacterium]|nr:MAG: hydrogenase maturation nickel metallochaperone HypA [Bacteroidota bacterium]
MHEISLVRNIFSTLEEEFSPEELERLTAIELKVGLLSNVEPRLMQNAFEAVTESAQKYTHVTLSVEVVPIEILCRHCNTHSLVEQYKFVCKQCGRPSSEVVHGTELLIHRVHFAPEEETAATNHLP